MTNGPRARAMVTITRSPAAIRQARLLQPRSIARRGNGYGDTSARPSRNTSSDLSRQGRPALHRSRDRRFPSPADMPRPQASRPNTIDDRYVARRWMDGRGTTRPAGDGLPRPVGHEPTATDRGTDRYGRSCGATASGLTRRRRVSPGPPGAGGWTEARPGDGPESISRGPGSAARPEG